MGHLHAHLALRDDDAVGADPEQDLLVQRVGGASDEVAHAEALEQQRRHDARLDLLRDRDDADVVVLQPEVAQRLLVGGVGLHDMGEQLADLLDALAVAVDPDDIVAARHERRRDRRAEAA